MVDVLYVQVCPVSSTPERSSPPCCQWPSSPAHPSMPRLTMDRCWTLRDTHTILFMIFVNDAVRSEMPRWSWSFSVDLSPVRLVCLGPQHPLHHETSPANGQRCRHHGDDHGHPSWYQPVLHTDGYHVASGASTTRCGESTPAWLI